jgi:hypothetical protein
MTDTFDFEALKKGCQPSTAYWNIDDNKLFAEFAGKPDEPVREALKKIGFSWWGGSGAWVITWSVGAEDFLLGLGFEEIGQFEGEADAAERQARYETYAEHAKERAEAASERVHAIADNIPLGQPILVGHHSEGHARADQARIESGMRKTVEESKKADYWRERARGTARRAAQKADPGVIQRRIEKLEADQRARDKHYKEYRSHLKVALLQDLGLDPRKATPEALAALKAALIEAESGCYVCKAQAPSGEDWAEKYEYDDQHRIIVGAPKAIRNHQRVVEHYETVIAYNKGLYDESGGTVADVVKFEVGGKVKIGGRWLPVVKVNKTTLSCETGVMPWPLKYKKSEVQEYRGPGEKEA